MKYNKRHGTAIRVAFVRAWESRQPPEIRLCHDPLAERFLDWKVGLFVKTALGRKVFTKIASPLQLGSLGYIPLRTRLVDDHLTACIEDGLEQLVILGAGFDSRAYRFDELKHTVKVFEVDRPENQAAKLTGLKRIFGSVPDHVSYVPIDFEKDSLPGSLILKGYANNLKTLFIWEGVTLYLDEEAVTKTLAFAASTSKPGSSIIFDYIPPAVLEGTSHDPLASEAVEFSKQVGEPYKFGIDPEQLGEFLRHRGLTLQEDYSVDQCMQRYHKSDHEDRKMLTLYRIAIATVSA